MQTHKKKIFVFVVVNDDSSMPKSIFNVVSTMIMMCCACAFAYLPMYHTVLWEGVMVTTHKHRHSPTNGLFQSAFVLVESTSIISTLHLHGTLFPHGFSSYIHQSVTDMLKLTLLSSEGLTQLYRFESPKIAGLLHTWYVVSNTYLLNWVAICISAYWRLNLRYHFTSINAVLFQSIWDALK